jgi:hypothetical protein
MSIAHLRGLLKPDYPHGARSVYAERMTLDALEAELFAELHYRRAASDALLYADKVNREGWQQLTQGTAASMKSMHRLMLLLPNKASVQRKGITDIALLEKLHETLEKVGWLR